MNTDEALDLAREIRAKEVVFTHLSHFFKPHDEAAEEYPLAYDGMTFEYRKEQAEESGSSVLSFLDVPYQRNGLRHPPLSWRDAVFHVFVWKIQGRPPGEDAGCDHQAQGS